MLSQIGIFLVDAVCGFLVYIALLRFLMQLFRAPFLNPIGQFVITFTEWGVQPLRKIISGSRGNIDWATLTFAFIAEMVLVVAVDQLLSPGTLGLSLSALLVLSVLGLLRASMYLLIFIVLVDFVLSWVNPHAPVAPVVTAITRPFYSIFRRFIPPIGGIDLSPLAVILVVQVLLIILDNISPSVRHLF
jgi:YggT family protein